LAAVLNTALAEGHPLRTKSVILAQKSFPVASTMRLNEGQAVLEKALAGTLHKDYVCVCGAQCTFAFFCSFILRVWRGSPGWVFCFVLFCFVLFCFVSVLFCLFLRSGVSAVSTILRALKAFPWETFSALTSSCPSRHCHSNREFVLRSQHQQGGRRWNCHRPLAEDAALGDLQRKCSRAGNHSQSRTGGSIVASLTSLLDLSRRPVHSACARKKSWRKLARATFC
jgi:hypothetical protein